MSTDTLQEKEWDILYDRLKTFLDTRGKSDAFGHGDFWIVDDNWGTPQHKVCISRIQFLTPQLVREVQRLLGDLALEWEIWFQLELSDPRYTGGPKGIVVRECSIQQDWDIDRLSRELGFAWDS